ncbi:unnamed protein product [Fraxinus pennsylvanica]|uniref:Uncharacterized protein n=1 Tax=Fraxinus pennsylvanica TaxID=56036 RepID=A0AAD2ECK8_9LAMI|nr:unnamed protein product [Fraxinus pennsylvanica]
MLDLVAAVALLVATTVDLVYPGVTAPPPGSLPRSEELSVKIQDLRFETATTRIKVTPDGEYLIASGIYPPQIKVYELKELSLKFERHFVFEIINFQLCLSPC